MTRNRFAGISATATVWHDQAGTEVLNEMLKCIESFIIPVLGDRAGRYRRLRQGALFPDSAKHSGLTGETAST
mgnify:CR=1 FL=1